MLLDRLQMIYSTFDNDTIAKEAELQHLQSLLGHFLLKSVSKPSMVDHLSNLAGLRPLRQQHTCSLILMLGGQREQLVAGVQEAGRVQQVQDEGGG
jgi:hypothetical protein